MFRALDAQRFEVLEKRVLVNLREVRQGRARLARTADRLVVHVGEIHHPLHREAARFEMPLQQVLEDVGAEIADVRVIINRRPAGVHLHASALGSSGTNASSSRDSVLKNRIDMKNAASFEKAGSGFTKSPWAQRADVFLG